jgi:hypothetical protein
MRADGQRRAGPHTLDLAELEQTFQLVELPEASPWSGHTEIVRNGRTRPEAADCVLQSC